jgi:hypothetical protein
MSPEPALFCLRVLESSASRNTAKGEGEFGDRLLVNVKRGSDALRRVQPTLTCEPISEGLIL